MDLITSKLRASVQQKTLWTKLTENWQSGKRYTQCLNPIKDQHLATQETPINQREKKKQQKISLRL